MTYCVSQPTNRALLSTLKYTLNVGPAPEDLVLEQWGMSLGVSDVLLVVTSDVLLVLALELRSAQAPVKPRVLVAKGTLPKTISLLKAA